MVLPRKQERLGPDSSYQSYIDLCSCGFMLSLIISKISRISLSRYCSAKNHLCRVNMYMVEVMVKTHICWFNEKLCILLSLEFLKILIWSSCSTVESQYVYSICQEKALSFWDIVMIMSLPFIDFLLWVILPKSSDNRDNLSESSNQASKLKEVLCYFVGAVMHRKQVCCVSL